MTQWPCARAQDTVISLLTAYPGPEVYQLEGHTGLRVRIGDSYDMTINYGIFNFQAPNFIYRFVKGETDYMMGVYPTHMFMREYVMGGRRVVEQELNLTGEQKRALLEAAAVNWQPSHRVYRYNYVLDNCATRPLQLIEASGDTLAFDGRRPAVKWHTFRQAMKHYHEAYPWYQFGIDLALGGGIDKPLTVRQRTFAPVMLEAMMAHATLGGRPVVSATRVLNDVAPDNAVLSPTPWWATPLAVALVVLGIGVWVTVNDLVRMRNTRWYDTVLFGVFGMAGCLLTFLVFVSVHEATSPNWLLLWLNPLCFIPAVGVWVARAKGLLIWYFFLNFALILLMCILLPFVGQTANVAFIPLIVADLMRSASYLHVHRRLSLDPEP